MSVDTCYASFMVRFWMDNDTSESESHAAWRCRVEHIQSERTWFFSSPIELFDFFNRHANNKDLWIQLDSHIVPMDD